MGKHSGSILFGKRSVLRWDLKKSREGFFRTGRGRSILVEGPKAEKAQEPTVESLVRRIWSLRVSEAERRVREGVSGWRQSQRQDGAVHVMRL